MLRFNQIRLPGLLVVFSLALSGCAQDLERMSANLRTATQELKDVQKNGLLGTSASTAAPGQSLAQSAETAQLKPTQLIVPNDKTVAAAMDVAMPNIKKVISLHRCMKSNDNMRMLNFYAVTGVDIHGQTQHSEPYPNHLRWMKYHDRNNCVAAQTMDQWSMPALNALRFRTVYFAEDSGEIINFQYEFKRVEDGSWKLNTIRSNVS